MDSAEPPVIIVHDLLKRFGTFTAVNGISFKVRRGEIFGFLGPNGSGKTTTIRMMLGLMRPTSGTVEVLGIKVYRDTEKIRPRVGYMSQRFSLYNDLTVLQNLKFYGVAYGLSNSKLQTRIKEALSMAGLKGRENAKAKDLSGGWRQRLALSAAILHRPEVLFLDEPTAGVDPLSRQAFWDLLYHLITEGITVFVTTHYMDEAEHCHRLAFIQHGNLIAYGSSSEIKNKIMRGDVLELEPSDALQAVKVLRSLQANQNLPFEEVELYGALVHIVAPNIQQYEYIIERELHNAGIRVGHISIIEPSLEDVFISAMEA
jgi:ABC-2 type transport system ATP-binding protein